MAKPLYIGIVVGEASGDILGAGLMEAIVKRYPDTRFEGVGGPRMQALGFSSLYDQERLAVMGLVEPLKRLPELLRMRKGLMKHFIAQRPDVFIGIDSPDFNLTLEEKLKQQGIATMHYVSPSVWAWRQKRIVKIARAVDKVLTLFPFEAKFYQNHQVPVSFVGHPLADKFSLTNDQQAARQALGLSTDKQYLALMPGSRGGEVKLLGSLFLAAAEKLQQHLPELEFLLPAANPARREQLEVQLAAYPELPIRLFDGQSHEVMSAADAVLMASGTTTLEAMLLKRPMVVAYKLAPLSYAIISRLLKSPFVALPNLLAGRELVPELIQEAATVDGIVSAILPYFNEPNLAKQLQIEFTRIHRQLALGASEGAADAVLSLAKQ